VRDRTTVRYCEAFKLQVVREMEQGRFESAGAAGLAHGVKGVETVARWARQYGKGHLLRRFIRVMKADEEAEVKGLRKRVRELERALANAHLFWTTADLESKLLDFKDYYNGHRAHAGLDGRTPEPGIEVRPPLSFHAYGWQKHGYIRHPSRHDSAALTLAHDGALLNDRVDTQNPRLNPSIIAPLFTGVCVWCWDVYPSQNFKMMAPQTWAAAAWKMPLNANSPWTTWTGGAESH
jgi:transposase-like protein